MLLYPVCFPFIKCNYWFIFNAENNSIIHNSASLISRGLSTPQSQMLSALKQENPHAQQTGLYIFELFKPFQKAVHWETNGYCFPTTPMAGSGTWLPCGMTPHPWLHPEVTPNMVLFAEATSMCHPMELPLTFLVLYNIKALARGTPKVEFILTAQQFVLIVYYIDGFL